MKLEDQVCSLELAKRLKELGIVQKSLFYWWRHSEKYILSIKTSNDQAIRSIENFDYFTTAGHKSSEYISAFTVAELGEMLHGVDLIIDTVSTNVGREPHQWCVSLVKKVEFIQARSKKHQAGIHQIEHLEHVEIEDTEANARAKMLIYLLENNLIKL